MTENLLHFSLHQRSGENTLPCLFGELSANVVLWSISYHGCFKRFLNLMKPDEEVMNKIEQENGIPTQATEVALVSFFKKK